MEKIEFKIGGVWEGDGFEIEKNYENEDSCYVPCKHAYQHPNSTQQKPMYIIPFVVIQINEGGYCTTGTCAQCIAEALQTLTK